VRKVNWNVLESDLVFGSVAAIFWLIFLIAVLLSEKGGEKMALKWWQKIVVRVRGRVFLRQETRKGWTSSLPIYLVQCPRKNSGHPLFEDYPHGFDGRFDCPECR